MTQPKALNAEGKCVCELRGSNHEKSICGKEFEAHPRIQLVLKRLQEIRSGGSHDQ